MECSIDGCGKPRYQLGWCRAHYSRNRRHGDPLGGGPPREPGRRCVNHPDRPHKGRGLCGYCLNRDNESKTEARCRNHPDRPVWCKGLCNRCYQSQLRVLKSYGLTKDEYDHHLSQPCGICGGKSDVIDHCHSTNMVRGALCTRCNVGVGVVEGWYREHENEIRAWIER